MSDEESRLEGSDAKDFESNCYLCGQRFSTIRRDEYGRTFCIECATVVREQTEITIWQK